MYSLLFILCFIAAVAITFGFILLMNKVYIFILTLFLKTFKLPVDAVIKDIHFKRRWYCGMQQLITLFEYKDKSTGHVVEHYEKTNLPIFKTPTLPQNLIINNVIPIYVSKVLGKKYTFYSCLDLAVLKTFHYRKSQLIAIFLCWFIIFGVEVARLEQKDQNLSFFEITDSLGKSIYHRIASHF